MPHKLQNEVTPVFPYFLPKISSKFLLFSDSLIIVHKGFCFRIYLCFGVFLQLILLQCDRINSLLFHY